MRNTASAGPTRLLELSPPGRQVSAQAAAGLSSLSMWYRNQPDEPEYFAGKGADEREIRELTDALYRRADWNWAQNGGVTVTHGCVDAENGKWIGRHGLSVRRPCVRACW